MSERDTGRPSGTTDRKYYQTVREGFALVIRDALQKAAPGFQVFQVIPVHLKKKTMRPALVVCPPEQVTDAGCSGVPGWIVEVASPGTEAEYVRFYDGSGVREYWIVEPDARQVITYCADQDHFHTRIYRFGDIIPVHTLPGASVDTARIPAPRRPSGPIEDPADWIC